MSKSIEPLKAHEIAEKWQKLAERRHRHLLELQRSGRWKRYYTEEKLLEGIAASERDVQEWSALSGTPADVGDDEIAPLKEAAE